MKPKRHLSNIQILCSVGSAIFWSAVLWLVFLWGSHGLSEDATLLDHAQGLALQKNILSSSFGPGSRSKIWTQHQSKMVPDPKFGPGPRSKNIWTQYGNPIFRRELPAAEYVDLCWSTGHLSHKFRTADVLRFRIWHSRPAIEFSYCVQAFSWIAFL